ncbi:hypothetical protein FGO68_gene5249 [Halteria grandinella]|uniref:Uncharacterized protein n=1 Tax=Halteria grandinella TaxID=5974 RepID=A0A8J8T0Y8_HALGN|nr:hypothetical protein FGO68_gene5249 [Halteria grandinella]
MAHLGMLEKILRIRMSHISDKDALFNMRSLLPKVRDLTINQAFQDTEIGGFNKMELKVLKLDYYFDSDESSSGLLDHLDTALIDTLEITNYSNVKIGNRNLPCFKTIKGFTLIDSKLHNIKRESFLKLFENLIDLTISFNTLDEIEKQILPTIKDHQNLKYLKLVQGEKSKDKLSLEKLLAFIKHLQEKLPQHLDLDIEVRKLFVTIEADKQFDLLSANIVDCIKKVGKANRITGQVGRAKGSGHVLVEVQSEERERPWVIMTKEVIQSYKCI